MSSLKVLTNFLAKLEASGMCFKLGKIRDSILVEVPVPGQRWEIEFMEDGSIEVEKFLSDGTIYDHDELETLFHDFSD